MNSNSTGGNQPVAATQNNDVQTAKIFHIILPKQQGKPPFAFARTPSGEEVYVPQNARREVEGADGDKRFGAKIDGHEFQDGEAIVCFIVDPAQPGQKRRVQSFALAEHWDSKATASGVKDPESKPATRVDRHVRVPDDRSHVLPRRGGEHFVKHAPLAVNPEFQLAQASLELPGEVRPLPSNLRRAQISPEARERLIRRRPVPVTV